MRSLSVTILGCALVAACLSGCGPPAKSLYERMQAEDSQVRLDAVHEAGEKKDAKAAPYLVDRLTDTEPVVRMFAILALEKITGDRMGYEYYGPAAKRDEAVQRWRDWLARRAGPAATTQASRGEGS